MGIIFWLTRVIAKDICFFCLPEMLSSYRTGPLAMRQERSSESKRDRYMNKSIYMYIYIYVYIYLYLRIYIRTQEG